MIFRFLIVLSYMLNATPRFFRVWLGAFIGLVWFHVLRFRRNLVIENLQLAFGQEKSAREIQQIAKANFRHYGLTLVEIFQSICWKPQDYVRNIELRGAEHLWKALAKGKGAYTLNSHMGNWEWMIGIICGTGFVGHVVVKHSKSKAMDAFLLRYRENTGVGVLYESGTARDILKALSNGKVVAFILDQFMGPPIGLPVKFFGKPAGTAIGLALLSDKKEAPIVPMYSFRDSNDRLIGVIEPELEIPAFSPDRETRLYERTQLFNDVIEKHVRMHPQQWMWLHRRWKAYRGEPRWKPAFVQAVTSVLIALLVGCASTQTEETPTGIALPDEPKINVPTTTEQISVVAETPETPAAPKEPEKPVEAEKPKKAPPVAKKKAGPAPRSFGPDQVPFEIGERLVLSLDWTAVNAGDVRMEVREGLGFQGRSTFRLWGNVLSSRVVDAFYHIDNTIESFVDKEWLLPYRFLLHMVEAQQLKETRVALDHKLNKAHYWSKRISKRYGDEVQDRVDAFNPLSQDAFSALYYARTLDYKMGQTREVPIYENHQNVKALLTPVANEMVHTKAGVFQCWKLSVGLKVENFTKPQDLFLWLSDDWKKYFVKFEAKLKFGSLRGELTSVRERL